MATIVPIILLCRVAWIDFFHFKVSNRDVLILISVCLFSTFYLNSADTGSAILAGLLLFVLGFIFWICKAMGAGDAKLLFAVGIFVGFSGLGLYSIFLLLASACFPIALLAPSLVPLKNPVWQQLKVIRAKRQIPYCVPIALAAILTKLAMA